MVKARDIMTTDVIWVKKETSIYEAGELLLQKNITGMPVVEDDMTITGVITEQDVLKLFHENGGGKNKSVEDFMTWPPVYCEDKDSFECVCNFMLFGYFRRVPVISKTGELIGIISRPDVLRHVLKLRCPGTTAMVKTVRQG
jgi:CBS domain-containing protein